MGIIKTRCIWGIWLLTERQTRHKREEQKHISLSCQALIHMRVSWVTWAISTSSIKGIWRWFQAIWGKLSLHCVLGRPSGLHPIGRSQNNSQGGILTRFPNHLNWQLSMWSGGSALISFWISECLTISLSLTSDILWWKLIFSRCIHNLDNRWGLKHRLAGKQRALLSGSAVSSSLQPYRDPPVNLQLHFSASELLELNLLTTHQTPSCQLVHLWNVWKLSKALSFKIFFFWVSFHKLIHSSILPANAALSVKISLMDYTQNDWIAEDATSRN